MFLSTIIPIEELQKIKISEDLDTDWLLFSNQITSKNLRCSHDFGVIQKYLRDYIYRIYFYPIFYRNPLFCYLMSNTYFYGLELLCGRYEHASAIWNMRRVPNCLGDEEKYPRIPKENRIFDGSYGSEYLEKKFNEIVDCNLNEVGINCVVLDGK